MIPTSESFRLKPPRLIEIVTIRVRDRLTTLHCATFIELFLRTTAMLFRNRQRRAFVSPTLSMTVILLYSTPPSSQKEAIVKGGGGGVGVERRLF